MSADRAIPTGVYYHRSDYLGVATRLLIDLVDIPVALGLSALMIVVAQAVLGGPRREGGVALLCAAVWFVYFVLLKRSAIRTVGYRVFGAQIVDLKGRRPGILSLLGRLLFAVVGPLNALIDLFWISGDVNRQAIRDKFAGAYVVRLSSAPAGSGPIRMRTYMFWGMTFLFREVSVQATQETSRVSARAEAV